MKKIMFNDFYGLTQAVLDGRKMQTRRIVPWHYCLNYGYADNATKSYLEQLKSKALILARYKAGEVVAVAQSYKDCGLFDVYQAPKDTAGWTNKMFVRADLMPHRIRITDVRVERLNDISESDCRAEGVDSWVCRGKRYYGFFDYSKDEFVRCNTPREAYAALIDKISGKGTFESNPYVFAYTFELVK